MHNPTTGKYIVSNVASPAREELVQPPVHIHLLPFQQQHLLPPSFPLPSSGFSPRLLQGERSQTKHHNFGRRVTAPPRIEYVACLEQRIGE